MDPLEFRLQQLRRDRAGHRQALSSKALRECYAEGAKRFGWSGRPLAPRQMRDEARLPRRLGHGHGACSTARCSRRRRAPCCAPTAPALVETQRDRHGAGRLDRARPDRRRQPRARHRAGRVPRRHLRPARRRHRRRLGPYGDRRRGASTLPAATRSPSSPSSPPTTRPRRCSAPAMPAWSRATDGCIAADDESRSESYADILARAGLPEMEGNGKGARDPADVGDHAHALARRGLRRGEGRSRSRPGPRHPPGRRLRRRADHQPAAGAQPALSAA